MSIFSKEIAITLPLAICLYEFYFLRIKKDFNWKYIAPFLVIILVIPLTMLITRSVDFEEMRRVAEDRPNISSGHYFLTQLRVITTYLRLLFIPINQNLDYDYAISKTLMHLPTLSSFLLLISILIIAKRISNRYKLISFGIFWFFLTLSPESSVIPIQDVIFEHRLYLPMIGYSLFLASGLYYLLKEKRIKVMIIILSLLVVCYSIMTHVRNFVWKDEFSLWDDTVRKSPLKARTYNNRGIAYQNKGNIDQAVLDYNKAIEINSNYALAYNNRGLAYQNKGNLDQAILDYNKAIEINSNYALAYNNRGLAYQDKGNIDQALLDYNKAIEIDPNCALAYYNRGLTYQNKGNLDQAILDYNKAIEIDPNYADVYYNRGVFYQDKDNIDQALLDYNRAIEINSNYVLAYNNRSVIYFKKQEYNKSWEDVRKMQILGREVQPEFIKQLKEASGREK
jgi:tetratricopeptide (TPR) repeat protein